ncbi:HPr family phosphocarrier protein [Anaeromicrobium sediminis]|uniref:Phosphocarrier protein HPr n=1 Tax=Anaeromicrobium sediminis TaxID=1478221 RepID=A0A267MEI1_9FIRM|nr:HPr family phosphocarrier protein [Anaeromicrobium sediminis]PAB57867.1 phosphocarrier protein HPr [Anaeromicrobium sediminis]
MYSNEVIIKNSTGIHARPAQMLVQESAKYKSSINILKDDVVYNAKSIMNIMSMGAIKGDKIIIEAQGEDEKLAVEGLIKIVENGFGE